MKILVTGAPIAKASGERVCLTMPSGETVLEVPLDLHDALKFYHELGVEVRSLMDATRERPSPACAMIMPFAREGRA